MKALIVDDEVYPAKYLAKLINLEIGEILVTIIVNSVEEARDELENEEFQFLFLDIEMPGMNGLDFLKTIKLNYEIAIIMVTAYDSFVLEALKMNALDYLIKPVEVKDLKRSVSKGMQFLKGSITDITKSKTAIHLIVFDNNSYNPIRINEIIYLKAEGSYTKIHIKHNSFLSSKRLGHFEKVLANNSFFRTHRSYLVNTNCILKIGLLSENNIVLTNKEVIPLSLSKHQALINHIKEA